MQHAMDNVVHSRSTDIGQGVCCNIILMLGSWEPPKKSSEERRPR